MREAKG